ncbi:MAG: response regulator transcription factor [Candidatus Dormibacteria bacterium]
MIADPERADTTLWGHRATDPVTVLIVDENPEAREAIAEIMEGDHTINVVGAAGRIAEAVSLAKLWEPDVAVLDVTLPDGSGWAAARRLRDVVPDIRLVAFASFGDALITRMMMAAGVFAYIIKGSDERILLAAVHGEEEPLSGGEQIMTGRPAAAVAG